MTVATDPTPTPEAVEVAAFAWDGIFGLRVSRSDVEQRIQAAIDAEVTRLSNERDHYRDALAWYAEPANYVRPTKDVTSPLEFGGNWTFAAVDSAVQHDAGCRARAVLAGQPQAATRSTE